LSSPHPTSDPSALNFRCTNKLVLRVTDGDFA
jgi:hypothetical protein